MLDMNFYKGKKVFVTGHTGFKGSWLCQILVKAGAEVMGYALEPTGKESLYEIIKLKDRMHSEIGDIRDYEKLKERLCSFQPDIILHLAAQPLVRESYKNPRYTYETNVMGTVNILECVKQCKSVQSFLNVTTDKVYENKEWEWGYRENEPLDGHDPYSNSKSCSELVTHSYKKSFFDKDETSAAISTARAGNVIGGGDFSQDRIIPDCIRAARKGETIILRNPYSIRPYQHVLEPLFAYLMIAEKQYENRQYAGWYNVGPDESDCCQTQKLVELFTKYWGEGLKWEVQAETNAPHEANFLKLDCSKLKKVFDWEPHWNIEKAAEKTVEWTKFWLSGRDPEVCMNRQIDEFLER